MSKWTFFQSIYLHVQEFVSVHMTSLPLFPITKRKIIFLYICYTLDQIGGILLFHDITACYHSKDYSVYIK